MPMKNINIGTRLTLGFGFLLLLLAIIAGIGLWRINASQQAHLEISALQNNERLVAAWERNIALNTTRAIAAARSTDKAAINFFENLIKETQQYGATLHKQIEDLSNTAEAKNLFENALQLRKQYLDGRATAMQQLAANDPAGQAWFDTEMAKAVSVYVDGVGKLLTYQQDLINQTTLQNQEINERAQLILAVLAIIALASGIILAVTITRSITGPLRSAVMAAQTVASRDLTLQLHADGTDEVAKLLQALESMTNNLRSTVSEVRQGSHEIATASDQILAGNQDLSSRTEEQAASLTQTAAAMEELTAAVRQNADNALQANTLASTASQVANRGGQIVAQVVSTMNSINDSSKRVEDIIGVIDSIAFQTNILALNAAVESARAGEAGRGFAVVAGEVRSLAQRSAQAAQEIKGLITESVTAAVQGNQLVSEAGTTMTEIVDSIKRVTDIMGEISAASQEQRDGIDEVNDAVLQMDQTTRQNAALVEQAAAAAASLQEQSATLSELAATFRVTAESPSRHATKDITPKPAAPAKTASATIAQPPKAPQLTSSRPKLKPAATKQSIIGAHQTSPDTNDDWEEF